MEQAPKKPLDESLGGAGVLDKYQAAGKVAKQVMEELLPKLQAGADIYELTRFGNGRITELCDKQPLGKKGEKGICFPVCISVNEVCGNYCPLKEESSKLAAGDIAKVELGVHFDNYPVVLAHTVCVGEPKEEDKQLLSGGFHALQAGVKSLGAGKPSKGVTHALEETAKTFKLSHVEGGATREIKRFLLDGARFIPSRNQPGLKTEFFEMKANEVYSVEVLVSANPEEGKTKTSEVRTTVFRRNIENSADLKTKMGRQFLHEVREKFCDMTFSINCWDDQLVARAGVNDSLNHNLIQPLPVFQEKSKAKVAHFKWTVAVLGKRLLLLAAVTEPHVPLAAAPKFEDAELQKTFDASLDSLTAKPTPAPKKEAPAQK